MLPTFHNGIIKFLCRATCMNMDSVKKKVTNMINLFYLNPSFFFFFFNQSKYQCIFLGYLIDISLHFIFIGIDEFPFIHFGKVCIWLIKKGKVSCKRCFSLKIMHFYVIFLFLQEKSLKYTICMISFTENALKFYYKYLIKTKLKNLREC